MIKDTDFEDLLEYKATYGNRPPEGLKEITCLFLISLGQPQHESTKLKAALKLMNATFKECIIVVADSLNRHSLAINNLDMTEEALYKLALSNGQAWINRNKPNIDRYLTIPHQILRWDHWLDDEEYSRYRNTVDRLYDINADYNKALNENAKYFVDKFSQKQEIANYQRAIQCSIEYLKEESAIIAGLWSDQGHKVVVYPGVNVAVVETMRIFKSSILWITYRLNSKKSTALSFQNIIDASPSNIYWKDSRGVYLGCNKATLQYADIENQEEFIGKTDFDLFDSKWAHDIRNLDLKIMTKGEPTVIKEIDNKGTVYLSHKSPLRNHDNEVIGIIGNSINITAQEHAEQKLKQRTKELAAALEAKERFLRNMSHEIRTPLSAITSIPDGLKEMYDMLTDEERKGYIDNIIESNERLMSLVSNLMDLSKYKEGKFVMELKSDSIIDVTKAVINEFKYVHGNISLEADADVPHSIICDSFRVSQVIRNLISNSIKHGGKDGPISVHLSSYLDRCKRYVKCSVKDEGVGVPDDDKEAIFDAFVESSKTQSFAGGTGLGLSIAKEIVEAHKGKIWVEDLIEGQIGARISFTLSVSI